MKVGDMLLKVTAEASKEVPSKICFRPENIRGKIIKFRGLNNITVEHFEHSEEERLCGKIGVYPRASVYDPTEPNPPCFVNEDDDCFRGVVFCLKEDLSKAKKMLLKQVKEAVEKYGVQIARSRRCNTNWALKG